MSLVEKYKNLNSSFEKKFLFRFNDGNGFYSEYNNMLLCMLYCLENKIQFCMQSIPGLFDLKDGWRDYFLPFCFEDNNNAVASINKRYLRDFGEKEANDIKRCAGYDFFTYELFWKIRNNDFYNKNFKIEELGLEGNLLEVLHSLNNMVYVFNPFVLALHKRNLKKLNLPKRYASMHVRGGDKYVEDKLYTTEEYMQALREHNPEIKDVFILTDDYKLFVELKEKFGEYNFYTLCSEDESGYFINGVWKMDKGEIYLKHVDLISSVEIMKHSETCIGTKSSNPGLFLTFARKNYKSDFIQLDVHNKEIWW